MRLEKVHIHQFRNLNNVIIDFNDDSDSSVYALAGPNGGGKSAILQFVFTMLHCFSDKAKHEYIENLLARSDYPEKTDGIQLVRFELSVDDKSHYLDFSLLDNASNEFDVFENIEELESLIRTLENRTKFFEEVKALNTELLSTKRVSPTLKDKLVQLFIAIKDIKPRDKLQLEEIVSSFANVEYQDVVKRLDSLISDIETSIYVLNMHKQNKEQLLTQSLALCERLEQSQLQYLTRIDRHEKVLVMTTNLDNDQQIRFSEKVFLTAPSSQVYLFLKEDSQHALFSNLTNRNNYENVLNEAKDDLANFFTFDFVSTDLIINLIQKAFEQDRMTKIQTKKYGDSYDSLMDTLSNLLENKELNVDENFERIKFTLKGSDKELAPSDLSHGELKKLSLLVWLKYIAKSDAIVLMDEVDIALHPKWQEKITKELTQWATNSQFLLATHSPHVLNSVHYKNLIKLVVEDGKTQVRRFVKPPVQRDINSTLVEVMEATELPRDLAQLQKQYRQLFDNGKADSNEAKQIKRQILEFESEDSEFFQQIKFERELL